MSEDLSVIIDLVSKRHKDFLELHGEVPYKVSADYQLLLNEVTAKITWVSSVFKEAGVISSYVVEQTGGLSKVILAKKGLDFKVEIVSNGTLICFRSAYPLQEDDFMSKQWYRPNDKGWNWPNFAITLLDFIHFTMYKSQEAEEVNFELLMGEKRD